jgi:Ca2+-dependent lipid-binding protein
LGVAVFSAKSIYKKRVIDGNFPLKKAKVEEIAAANGDDVELQPIPKGEKAPESTGSINFRCEYHPPRFEGKLDIEIIKATDLYNADGGGFMSGVSDPYVRVMIDDDKVAKTHTVKNDLSPVWNETLHVAVTGEHTWIFLVVHDDDHASCDECLGHVKINAADLMDKNEITETVTLQPKPGSKDEGKIHGTISYRIKHTPPQLDGTITATVIEANNLADMDHGLFQGKSDPYTILKFDNNEVAKTKTIDSNKNPEWNEELGPIPVSGSVKTINFTVMDYDEDTEDDHLGTITFGAEQIIMDRTVQGKFALRAKEGQKSVRGTLTVSLTYEPNE